MLQFEYRTEKELNDFIGKHCLVGRDEGLSEGAGFAGWNSESLMGIARIAHGVIQGHNVNAEYRVKAAKLLDEYIAYLKTVSEEQWQKDVAEFSDWYSSKMEIYIKNSLKKDGRA